MAEILATLPASRGTRMLGITSDVIAVFAGSATGYLLITIPSGLLLGVVERRVVVLR